MRAENKLLLYGGLALLAVGILYKVGESAVNSLTNVNLNPADPNNTINTAANSAFQSVTGNTVDSIGTWLYSIFNPIQYDPNNDTQNQNVTDDGDLLS